MQILFLAQSHLSAVEMAAVTLRKRQGMGDRAAEMVVTGERVPPDKVQLIKDLTVESVLGQVDRGAVEPQK